MFRNTHRLPKHLAAAIAVVALAVPATSAGYVDHRSPDAQDAAIDAQRGVSRQTLSSPPQRDRGYVDHRSPDAQDAAFDAQRGISRATLTSAPAKTVQASDSGFDWGDAGIGAGTVLGLGLITVSLLFTVVHRRRRSVETV